MNIKKHVVRVAVVSSIADVLGEPVESIGESDNLVDDLGLDSVSAAQLLPVAELEDCSENSPLRFGVGRAGPDGHVRRCLGPPMAT
jgi:hypothetical protein